MFDNIAPQQNPAPNPRPSQPQSPTPPKPVEDMFGGLDKNEKIITAPRPMMAIPPSPTASAPLLTAEPVHKRHFFLLGAIIIIVLLIVAGGIFYSRWQSQPTTTTDITPIASPADNQAVAPEQPAQPTVADMNAPQDSDNDGLSDTEEAALGTNPYKTDSDNDALSDYDEANVYKTNPMNPDTDGDVYLDGEEVSKGYNPNGLGKLLNTQAEINRLQNNATQ